MWVWLTLSMLNSSKWGRKWIVCLKTWDRGRKEVLFSEIYMLDTCLCVEVIHFQIGIKLLCIHFTRLGKYTNPISITIGHLVSDVVSRAGFLKQICIPGCSVCSSVILSIVRLVHWLDWTSVIAKSRKYFKYLKSGDQKRNHFTCLLASLDC